VLAVTNGSPLRLPARKITVGGALAGGGRDVRRGLRAKDLIEVAHMVGRCRLTPG